MRRHLRRSRRKFLSPRAWKVRLVFWTGAILIGLVCALLARLAEHANAAFLALAQAYPLAPLVVTPVAMTLIAWLTLRWFPGSQGSGIPQAIAALRIPGKAAILSLRIAIGKFILVLLGLLGGGSIGREGPSVHIGASIMFSLGRLVRFPPHYMERGLILAGGAAGVAAAFNTPLAGIMFAIEEMSRSFENRTSGIVTVAVVLAGVTALAILGPYHYFGVVEPAPAPTLDVWLAVLVCGIGGGLAGGLFGALLVTGSQRLAPFARRFPLRLAFFFGLALACIAWLSDYSASGTGYAEAKAILAGTAEYDPWYSPAKFLATLASYLTGIPGGIFAPSLATGAGVGADLGHWLPVAPLSVMILLGMLGYFCGVVQSPLTAFVIVMEMTAERNMLLPLLATSFLAYGASHLVNPRPLYHTLAMAFVDKSPQSRTSGSDAESKPRAHDKSRS
ncbi:MAG: chloride channel protein [Gammaproteobacteria bacterium]|nr:MAG: chloride channel protein [Gammaproteobacteria bacterium]